MKFINNNYLKKQTIRNYGSFLFLIGIFFIPSTLFIGALFLLPAAIIGSNLNDKPYLKDKWNYPFIVFGLLILMSSFLQNFVFINNYDSIWNPILSIAGMGNWLPFIWFFWAFQPYINSESKRKTFAKTLIAGTFPVLITGFGQYFFDWTGPFETLNGLIIWYQRPVENPGGLTGLFNNQNYTGSWLNIIWPFCLALFLEKRKDFFRKTISFGFLFSVGYAAFLTFSRNAWIGLLTSTPIMLEKKRLKQLVPFISIVIFISFFLISSIFKGELQNYLRDLFPEKILLEFSDEGYKNLDATRLEIFSSAFNLIKTSPIFGIGAGSFSAIYFMETTFWKGHSHNLLLELGISYGLPSSIIFFTAITFILYLSGKSLFLKRNINNISLFDKAFWSASLFFLISQLFDIQYLDGKISIIIWILISGLKNIIEENNKSRIS